MIRIGKCVKVMGNKISDYRTGILNLYSGKLHIITSSWSIVPWPSRSGCTCTILWRYTHFYQPSIGWRLIMYSVVSVCLSVCINFC